MTATPEQKQRRERLLSETLGLLHRRGQLCADELRAMVWELTQIDLGQMVRHGYVATTRYADGRELYRVTNAGRQRVGLPVDQAGLTPGRMLPIPSGAPYHCPELRPFVSRPGANDALAVPSRFGNRLRWRDGREIRHPDHKERA